MYRAKSRQSDYARYDAARDHHSPARLGLIGELRGAIESGQLVLHYQPKIDVDSGRDRGLRGARALGAPRARAAAPGRVHGGGREHEHDPPAHPAGARAGAGRRGRLARAGARAGRRRQPVGALPQRPGVPGHGPRPAGPRRHPAGAARARADRERDHGRPGAHQHGPGRAAPDGRRAVRRRLRDRLLVAVVPAAPPGRRAEDRPHVRGGDRTRDERA